jgi:hypothetical protein
MGKPEETAVENVDVENDQKQEKKEFVKSTGLASEGRLHLNMLPYAALLHAVCMYFSARKPTNATYCITPLLCSCLIALNGRCRR